MPTRRYNTTPPSAKDAGDPWYFLRLSSLERSVAVMLMFGVAASIVQPIISSTRSSVTHSVERLNDAFHRAGSDAPRAKTAARDCGQTNAQQRDLPTPLVCDSQPPMQQYPVNL